MADTTNVIRLEVDPAGIQRLATSMVQDVQRRQGQLDELREQYENGAIVLSICGDIFALDYAKESTLGAALDALERSLEEDLKTWQAYLPHEEATDGPDTR